MGFPWSVGVVWQRLSINCTTFFIPGGGLLLVASLANMGELIINHVVAQKFIHSSRKPGDEAPSDTTAT